MQVPNYTQVPNCFIEQMGKYSGAAVKIFFVICRKTLGWHKDTDDISYSQLQKMSGLTVNGLKNGLKELLRDGWIVRERVSKTYTYTLNFDSKVSKNDTIEPIIVSKIDTTKERPDNTTSSEVVSKPKVSMLLQKQVEEDKKRIQEAALAVTKHFMSRYSLRTKESCPTNFAVMRKYFTGILNNHITPGAAEKTIDFFFACKERKMFGFPEFRKKFDSLLPLAMNTIDARASPKIPEWACPKCGMVHVSTYKVCECGWGR